MIEVIKPDGNEWVHFDRLPIHHAYVVGESERLWVKVSSNKAFDFNAMTIFPVSATQLVRPVKAKLTYDYCALETPRD